MTTQPLSVSAEGLFELLCDGAVLKQEFTLNGQVFPREDCQALLDQGLIEPDPVCEGDTRTYRVVSEAPEPGTEKEARLELITPCLRERFVSYTLSKGYLEDPEDADDWFDVWFPSLLCDPKTRYYNPEKAVTFEQVEGFLTDQSAFTAWVDSLEFV